MNKFLGLTAIAASLLAAVPANAVVIGFDDIAGDYVPESYKGLKWANAGVLHKDAYPGSGYDIGAISGSYVAYGGWSSSIPMKITSDGDAFSFNSAYFTAAWEPTVQLLIEGFIDDDDIADYTVTLNLDNASPLFFEANWINLRELRLTTLSATPLQHFAVDNLMINEDVPVEVPEPMTLGLVGMGLLGIAGARRRKR